jgi:hypothetical protein
LIYTTEIQILLEHEDKRSKLKREMIKIESVLTEYMHGLSVDNVDILVSNHSCKNIDDPITKRQTLEKVIEEKTNSLNTFQRSKSILEEEFKRWIRYFKSTSSI